MSDKELEEVLARLGRAVEANENRWQTVFENDYWSVSEDAVNQKLIIKDKSGTTYSESVPGEAHLQVFWSENDQPCQDDRWIKAHRKIAKGIQTQFAANKNTSDPDYSYLNNKRERYAEALRMKSERNWDPED